MVYPEGDANAVAAPPIGTGGQGDIEEISSNNRQVEQGPTQRLSLQSFLSGPAVAEIGGLERRQADRFGRRGRGPSRLAHRGRMRKRPRRDEDDEDEDEQDDEEENEEDEEETAESSTESEGEEQDIPGDSSSEDVEGGSHSPGQDVAEMGGDEEISFSGAGAGDWEAALPVDQHEEEPRSETKRKRGRPPGSGSRRRPRSAASAVTSVPAGPPRATEVTVFTTKAAALKEGPPGVGKHFHLVGLANGHVAWVQRPLGRREERVWRRHLVAASSVVVLEELGRLTLAEPKGARTGEEKDVAGTDSASSVGEGCSNGGERPEWVSTGAVRVEAGLDRQALARLLAEKDSGLQASDESQPQAVKPVAPPVASEAGESEVFQGQSSKGVSKVVIDAEIAPFEITAMDETSLYLEPPPPPPPGLTASGSATSSSSGRNRRSNSRASMGRTPRGGATPTPTDTGGSSLTPGRSESPLLPGAPAAPSTVLYSHPAINASYPYALHRGTPSHVTLQPGSLGPPGSAFNGMARLPPPQPQQPLDALNLPPRVPSYHSNDDIQRLVHPHPLPPPQRVSPGLPMFGRQPPPTAPLARPPAPTAQPPEVLHQMLMTALVSLMAPYSHGQRSAYTLPVGYEAWGLSSDPSVLMDQLVAQLSLPAYLQQQALYEHRERLEKYLAQTDPQFLPVFHSLGSYEKFKWLVFIDHLTKLTQISNGPADTPRRQAVVMQTNQVVEATKAKSPRPQGAAPQADTEAMQSMVDSFSRSYKGKLYESKDGELFEVVSVFYDLAYEGWPFAVVRNKQTRKLLCPTPPLSLPNYLEPLLVEYFKKTHPDDPLVLQLRDKPQTRAPPTASGPPTARSPPHASAQPPSRGGALSSASSSAGSGGPGAIFHHALLVPPSGPASGAPLCAPPSAPIQPLSLPRVTPVDGLPLHHRVYGMTLQDLQDDYLTLAHQHGRPHPPPVSGAGMGRAGIPSLGPRTAQQSTRRKCDLYLVWRVMEARPDWAKVVRETADRLWATQHAGAGAQPRPEQPHRARRPPKELSWHIDTLDTPETVA